MSVGVYKSNLPFLTLFFLGILAGAFIGFGAHYYTIVISDNSLSFSVARIIGGICFSMGLLLVVVAGAELFTGNVLIVMAWVDKKISLWQLLKNWGIVIIANFIGAIGLALLIYLSGSWHINADSVGQAYLNIAMSKLTHSIWQDFWLGVLCNNLVCLAIWMSFAGRTVIDKFIVIIFPISAFVAAGFEHSIANIYFFTIANLIKMNVSAVPANYEIINLISVWQRLLPVILGNIAGGSILVALIYWVIYRRHYFKS